MVVGGLSIVLVSTVASCPGAVLGLALHGQTVRIASMNSNTADEDMNVI